MRVFRKFRFCVLLVTTTTTTAMRASATRPQVRTHPIVITQAEVFEGLRFPPHTKLEVMENGHVYYAWPGEDFDANGIRILKGTQLMLHGNGKVSSLWTVSNQKILDTILPSQTWVTFK